MRPELWTVADAAQYLQWNPQYVRRLCRARRIPSIRLGRQWRFVPQRLMQWVESGQPTPIQQPSLFGEQEQPNERP